MRQRLIPLLIALLLALPAGLACAESQDVPISSLVPTYRQQRATMIINQALEHFHYREMTLDDGFAEWIFEKYLEALDPNRSFFLQGDFDRFEHTAHRLDDDLTQGRLDAAFEIFRLYRQRVDERVRLALSLLDAGFDFKRQESYRFDRSEAERARKRTELDEIWRKRVKNDWLGLRLSKQQENKIPGLLRRRYQGLARRIRQFDSDDVFRTFINAYTESLEPHTSYMSPSTSENFDISMRLSLEGIGAVLRGENEYTVVQRTIPGGPARQSGLIHSGDQIVGVAQGKGGVMEDVIGWRLQDVVDKIRGPKGSVVRLQIQPKSSGSDGATREISLVRNEIRLEDQAAKSYLIDNIDTVPRVRIGVIEIPAFYRDFRAESKGNKDFRSTTQDVRGLIRRLKRQGVDGIVVDLRSNGGGSLTEATALTGLFIDTGPIVQVKDAFGKVEVETDPDPGILYKGPLAVLVDRNSASASEIFAAAMQDYGRGIIIGEPTFGKGTVQTLIDLNRFVPKQEDDLGRLRLTVAEFFRISGGSTQLRGVVPDIAFPTMSDSDDHGERALDNPLPWAKIEAADYARVSLSGGEIRSLRQRSEKRIRRDPGFDMLTAQEQVLRELDDQTVASLREWDRRIESKRRERVLKDQRNAFLRTQGIDPVDENTDDVDQDALEKQQEIIARIQVKEAARILADAIRLGSPGRPRSAMRD
ncbi:carboxy terminal-processing peptidase [Candidatus Thiosymbion oneisti]|uniref:carboxy terminal-processing peptidase n=1 Tax=Candidatus Thiosymbion oneisti TaxID=589554 RepID=UPI000A5810C0|nr:carboxy terminal-processing peptidase [Candidatus Thiosymbion oneisti]